MAEVTQGAERPTGSPVVAAQARPQDVQGSPIDVPATIASPAGPADGAMDNTELALLALKGARIGALQADGSRTVERPHVPPRKNRSLYTTPEASGRARVLTEEEEAVAQAKNWARCWAAMVFKDLVGYPLWEQQLHDILQVHRPPQWLSCSVQCTRSHAHTAVYGPRST